MTQKDFKDISIRGRVAFCITCLKTYVEATYPDSDYSAVLDLACRITEKGTFIDEATLAYTEIVPEYLYEFDHYADAEFEYLTKEQYNEFTHIIPKDDARLNRIMHAIRDIAWEYCYNAIEEGAKRNLRFISDTVDVMRSSNLPVPDIKEYERFSFSTNDGWGDFISRDDYL